MLAVNKLAFPGWVGALEAGRSDRVLPVDKRWGGNSQPEFNSMAIPHRCVADDELFMLQRVSVPVSLSPLSAMGWYLRLLRDPLPVMERLRDRYGPFIRLPHPRVPTKPPRDLLIAIGSDFNRHILDNPATWRPVSLGFGGGKNSATRRLSKGLIRMNGPPHEHYRRMLLPTLQRRSVNAMGAGMVRFALEEVHAWPKDQEVDIWMMVRKLVRTLAIGLLFGDDRKHGDPIAEMVNEMAAAPMSAACPINIRGTPYNRFFKNCEALERHIIQWAECKRGQINKNDLLSLLINSPDETGNLPSTEQIIGHVPLLFGAAYETCQNAVIWTLILLDQHPIIARSLMEELTEDAGDEMPAFDAIMQLPWLNAVIKESMRILPPVPHQVRVAQHDTYLHGYPVRENTRVGLSAILTNRDPDLYPEPKRFKPERWISIAPSPYEYAVFSAGPRGCPGYYFGLCMVKVAIAAIYTSYRLALMPNTKVDYKVRIMMSPRDRVAAVLHRQDGMFSPAPLRGQIRSLVQFPH
jgi:cytochrome P450